MPTLPNESPLTSVSDVEAALVRPLSDNESDFIDTLIDQAGAKLRSLLPGIDARVDSYGITDNGLDPQLVAGVLADVIARRLLNPQRLWSAGGETMGPFAEGGVTYAGPRGGSGSQSFGNLVITPDDLAQLSSGSAFVAPGTIRTRPRWGAGYEC